MTAQLEKVFLGHTPADQRKFITAVLRFLKDKFQILILPAIGQFSLAKCAIEAGYEKRNIFTSDMSLYSTLLGYLYSGKNILDLGIQVSPTHEERWRQCTNDFERAAFLVWLMKQCQLKPTVYYEKVVYDELVENRELHINQLTKKLEQYATLYSGIHYEIADMRDVLTAKKEEGALTIVNPPVFRNGYTKMFNFKGNILWNSGISEFDFLKEYKNYYSETKKLSAPHIWYRFRDTEGFDPKDIIYCKEYDVDKRDYWLLTKPEVLEGFSFRYTVEFLEARPTKPYPTKIFTDEDTITENSEISFVGVPEEVAMYYRDLFAHKLGNTKAEHYYLMLVDGKIYSVCGFHTTKLFGMQSTRVFENFGFSVPLKSNPHSNRLLMMLITSTEFGEVIRKTTSKVNRIYDLRGLRTTCLSKYRSIKTHRDILNRESRKLIPEGNPNAGMYHIVADADFHNHTFKETLRWFLEEQKEQGYLVNV